MTDLTTAYRTKNPASRLKYGNDMTEPTLDDCQPLPPILVTNTRTPCGIPDSRYVTVNGKVLQRQGYRTEFSQPIQMRVVDTDTGRLSDYDIVSRHYVLRESQRLSALDEAIFLACSQAMVVSAHDVKKSRQRVMENPLLQPLLSGDTELTHAFLRAPKGYNSFQDTAFKFGGAVYYLADFGLGDSIVAQNVAIPGGPGLGRDVIEWNSALGLPTKTENCKTSGNTAVFFFAPSQQEVGITLSGVRSGSDRQPYLAIDATMPRNLPPLEGDIYRIFMESLDEFVARISIDGKPIQK